MRADADVLYVCFLHEVMGVSGIGLDDGIGLDEKVRSGNESPIVDAGVVAPDDKEWAGKMKSKLDAGVLGTLAS